MAPCLVGAARAAGALGIGEMAVESVGHRRLLRQRGARVKRHLADPRLSMTQTVMDDSRRPTSTA